MCVAMGVKTVNLTECQDVLDSSSGKSGKKKSAKGGKNICCGPTVAAVDKYMGRDG